MKKKLLIIGAILFMTIVTVALGVYEIVNSVGFDKEGNKAIVQDKDNILIKVLSNNINDTIKEEKEFFLNKYRK